jgi:hypothetical protein
MGDLAENKGGLLLKFAEKAAADSFIATPLLGIPIYYACKPAIEGAASTQAVHI